MLYDPQNLQLFQEIQNGDSYGWLNATVLLKFPQKIKKNNIYSCDGENEEVNGY